MQLSIKYEEFESIIASFRNEIDEIITKDWEETDANSFTRLYDDFEDKCLVKIRQCFDQLKWVNQITDVLLHGMDSFHRQFPGFKLATEEIRKNFNLLSRNLEHLKLLTSLSDPISEGISFYHKRLDLTVNQKKDFVLEKLYQLRRTDEYWSVSLIFELNDVTMDGGDEARQISISLGKSGYVTVGDYEKSNMAKITVKGKAYLEKKIGRPKATGVNQTREKNQNSMDIFISHSGSDRAIAKLLIELVRSALPIPAMKIRCTSVDGYRLPAGASTNDQLRNEVNDCKVLIGIISPKSINSAYVMFELGARWGILKPLIPLVTNDGGVDLLKGPLSGINCLNVAIPAQVHQLVADLAKQLNLKPESAAVYQDKLDDLVRFAAFSDI